MRIIYENVSPYTNNTWAEAGVSSRLAEAGFRLIPKTYMEVEVTPYSQVVPKSQLKIYSLYSHLQRPLISRYIDKYWIKF